MRLSRLETERDGGEDMDEGREGRETGEGVKERKAMEAKLRRSRKNLV